MSVGLLNPKTIAAFIMSEDQGFWTHQGVEVSALAGALRRNLEAGAVRLGGSTITMQTAKNLFLSHERTIHRKMQELILARHLENQLPKSRILEIYLNIAEFGPNIFGIQTASQHYFGKSADLLSLNESLFLANLLPSPVKRHRHYCRGIVSPAFSDLMKGLARRMYAHGRIQDDDLESVLEKPIKFHSSLKRRTKHCQMGSFDIAKEVRP